MYCIYLYYTSSIPHYRQKINHLKSALLIFLPITAVLIPPRYFPTRLLVRFGITGAFHALPKAWFWGEKTLGSIKNSNRLSRKSVRTRRNRRRLSDSDFRCIFDAKMYEKPWKHGIFGVLASAVIFRQIPPSSVFTTWLEIVLSVMSRHVGSNPTISAKQSAGARLFRDSADSYLCHRR